MSSTYRFSNTIEFEKNYPGLNLKQMTVAQAEDASYRVKVHVTPGTGREVIDKMVQQFVAIYNAYSLVIEEIIEFSIAPVDATKVYGLFQMIKTAGFAINDDSDEHLCEINVDDALAFVKQIPAVGSS